MKGYPHAVKVVRSILGALFVALLASMLLTPAAMAATTESAATNPTPPTGPTADRRLPPLPDWPIVGPILRMLGVVKIEQPEALPTPDPSIPEYRITSFEDAEALPAFASGERVRLIASESDLNAMIAQAIEEDVGDGATVVLSLSPGVLGVTANVDQGLLREANINIPRLGNANLNVKATMGLGAVDCELTVQLSKLSINGWGLGLRVPAQRMISARLPEAWPQQICLEHVYLLDGEAAVEGYQR